MSCFEIHPQIGGCNNDRCQFCGVTALFVPLQLNWCQSLFCWLGNSFKHFQHCVGLVGLTPFEYVAKKVNMAWPWCVPLPDTFIEDMISPGLNNLSHRNFLSLMQYILQRMIISFPWWTWCVLAWNDCSDVNCVSSKQHHHNFF